MTFAVAGAAMVKPFHSAPRDERSTSAMAVSGATGDLAGFGAPANGFGALAFAGGTRPSYRSAQKPAEHCMSPGQSRPSLH
jgi:hypothetical protein